MALIAPASLVARAASDRMRRSGKVNLMDSSLWKSAAVAATIAILVAAPLAASSGNSSSSNTPKAANKTAAVGSGIEFLGPGVSAGSATVETTILSTSIKTSATQDLVFQVSLECALWTTVTTIGNQRSESTARVVVWVEFDGVPVPVGTDDTDAPGQVVFCDRTHRQVVSDLDDEDARIEQYLATRTANAFNWFLEDAGSGTHSVAVKARLVGDAFDTAFAQAGVGHRTLVVEPVRFVTDHT
ncbi:MAG TPA: hypothetical protein VFH47_07575 [Candidatus Thermoplasmatota archaeon]|nr:hypothetical protein [Candidatus Thermoplasmatota archaeon]